MTRSLLTAGLMLCLCCPLLFAQREHRSAAARDRTVDAGFLIIDGAEQPPPFRITVAAAGMLIEDYPISLDPRQAYAHGQRKTPRDPSPERAVALLARHLQNGGLLIVRNGVGLLLDAYDAPVVLEALTQHAGGDIAAQVLADRIGRGAIDEWRALANAFSASPTLHARLAELREAEAVRQADVRKAISEPLQWHRGLAIAGFLLAVLAVGFLLVYRPYAAAGWRGINADGLAIRCVEQGVMLLFIMSLYDLAATIVTTRDGAVVELNPLAATMIDTPLALASFKLSAILLSAWILLACRRHRAAQFGTWWACVIHAVLLLRWSAVLSSLVQEGNLLMAALLISMTPV